jgi:hypothetical protein
MPAIAAAPKLLVRFNRMTHPIELGPAEVTRFLASLAETGRVSASTQTQALSALLFLYRDGAAPRD